MKKEIDLKVNIVFSIQNNFNTSDYQRETIVRQVSHSISSSHMRMMSWHKANVSNARKQTLKTRDWKSIMADKFQKDSIYLGLKSSVRIPLHDCSDNFEEYSSD